MTELAWPEKLFSRNKVPPMPARYRLLWHHIFPRVGCDGEDNISPSVDSVYCSSLVIFEPMGSKPCFNGKTILAGTGCTSITWYQHGTESMHTYWKWNVILIKFSSLAAMKVVNMTTFSAACDVNFIKMMIFPFQYRNDSSTAHPYLPRTAATVDNDTE